MSETLTPDGENFEAGKNEYADLAGNRIDDVEKAHEMALAEDKDQTEAAKFDRIASQQRAEAAKMESLGMRPYELKDDANLNAGEAEVRRNRASEKGNAAGEKYDLLKDSK